MGMRKDWVVIPEWLADSESNVSEGTREQEKKI